MLVKRLLLAVISLALGFGIDFLLVEFVLNTTVPEYMWGPDGIPYFAVTGLSLAIMFALILDKFMGTEMLPK